MQNSGNKYRISVVVPTYNRSTLLNYTLNSLVLQNMDKADYEVIVTDDGSTDNTLEVVQQYQTKLNLKYVFQEDKGYRPGSARNGGIRVAEGTVCVMVDSGVILNTNCLEEHDRFHSTGDNKVAIGYVYGFDQGDGLIAMLEKMVIPEQPAESIRLMSKDKLFYDVRDYHYTNYQDKIHNLPAPWLYFWTCHVSARKDRLEEVGLFDEIYDGRWGGEDNDLGYRLHQAGGEFHVLRSAKSIHYPHGGDVKSKLEQGYENCLMFYRKFPTPETKLFIETYKNEIFTDINAILMRSKWFENV